MPSAAITAYKRAADPLPLMIGAIRLDGDAAIGLTDNARRRIALGSKQWSNAEIVCSTFIPPHTYEEVLPSTETQLTSVSVVATAECRQTRWRTGVRLSASNGSTGGWSGLLQIPRGDVAGSIVIALHLVRSANGRGGFPYASKKGLRLASSSDWTVQCDEVVEQASRAVDIRWENFRRSDRSGVPADAAFWLETVTEEPVLLLNSGVEGMRDLLSYKGVSPLITALRDLVIDWISHSSWLVMCAAVAGNAGAVQEHWERDLRSALEHQNQESSTLNRETHNIVEGVLAIASNKVALAPPLAAMISEAMRVAHADL